MQLYQQAVCAWPDMDIIFTEQIISLTSQLVFPTKLVKSFIHIVVVTVTSTATPASIVSEWVRVINRRIRAVVTMRRGVNWTAADEILRCRCRAGESWLADCSNVTIKRKHVFTSMLYINCVPELVYVWSVDAILEGCGLADWQRITDNNWLRSRTRIFGCGSRKDADQKLFAHLCPAS